MAVTPAILLAKLQGLNISTEVLDHPAVLTVEVHLRPPGLEIFCYHAQLEIPTLPVYLTSHVLNDSGGKQVHW